MGAILILLTYVLMKDLLPVGSFHVIIFLFSFVRGFKIDFFLACLVLLAFCYQPNFSTVRHSLLSPIIVLFPFLIISSSPWRVKDEYISLYARILMVIISIDFIRLFYFDFDIRKSFHLNGLIFFNELGELYSLLFLVSIYYFKRGKKHFFWLGFIYTYFASFKKNLLEFGIVFFRANLRYILLLLILGFFFGGVIFENIQENLDYFELVGAEGHVRAGMYIIAFGLAYSNFPFGVGVGKFGSLASLNPYSNIYHETGADLLGFNAEVFIKTGETTLLDTYWPGVLAELGALGLFLVLIVVFKVYRTIGNSFSRMAYVLFWIEGLVLFTPGRPLILFTLMILILSDQS